MTKVSTGRRRCEWCGKAFKPKTGGRPAVFCGQACRQRAYEARKRSHTHSDAAAHNAPEPRIASPVVTSRQKPFFTLEDAEQVFKKIGQARDGTDFGSVAGKLDLIADDCVHASRRGTAPTAGEHQKWFQLVGRVARKLLVHFGVNGPLDHLDGNRTAGAVNALLRAVPPNVSLDFYLRDKMAKEIKAPTPSEWHAIRAFLRGLQFLTHRTQLAADTMEKDKGALRTAPPEEIYLVAQLHPLYAEVTGDNRWYTNFENETQGGLFVSFVSAVAAHIHDRLEILEPPAPARLVNGLKALSTSRRRIIKRIQQVRKLP
jgi:hypothetical protein